MYWFNYEKGKVWLCEYNSCTDPTFSITFTAGAISGSVSLIYICLIRACMGLVY